LKKFQGKNYHTKLLAEEKATTPVTVRYRGRTADINVGEWSFDTLIGMIKDCFRELRNRGKQIWLIWSQSKGEAVKLVTNEVELQSAVQYMQNQPRSEVQFGVVVGQKSGRDAFTIPIQPQL
jgi:hypothetical protein